MDTKSYEKLMINVLQGQLNIVEQIDPEVLKNCFDNHPESKRSTFQAFIKRCKGHIKLINSPEWETLDESKKAIIMKYAKKDTCTIEELSTIKELTRE